MNELLAAQAKFERALGLFQRRVDLASRDGKLLAVVPMKNGRLVAVGGPRNRNSHVARGVKLGMRAAYNSAQRAQREGNALMRQLRGGQK